MNNKILPSAPYPHLKFSAKSVMLYRRLYVRANKALGIIGHTAETFVISFSTNETEIPPAFYREMEKLAASPKDLAELRQKIETRALAPARVAALVRRQEESKAAVMQSLGLAADTLDHVKTQVPQLPADLDEETLAKLRGMLASTVAMADTLAGMLQLPDWQPRREGLSHDEVATAVETLVADLPALIADLKGRGLTPSKPHYTGGKPSTDSEADRLQASINRIRVESLNKLMPLLQAHGYAGKRS